MYQYISTEGSKEKLQFEEVNYTQENTKTKNSQTTKSKQGNSH